MDPDALQRFYRYREWRWAGPLYYNYPDGEDLAGKLSFCGQIGFILSAPIGIMNAYIGYPTPTSQMGRLVKVLRAVIPGVGMGLAFAATTYYATKIREKDDWVNHSIGGIAAGTILGASTRLGNGILTCAILAPLAGVLKYNYPRQITNNKRRFPNYLLRKIDFSGVPDKGDNWVKAFPPKN